MRKHWYMALPAVGGILFLLWLASCARLAYDDYLFAACFKQHSFIEAIKILSNTHTFRWTTFLLQDLVFGIVPGKYFPISIFLFFLVFYLVWIYQMHKLIKVCAKKFLSLVIAPVLSLSLAMLFITSIYFTASQAVETFTFHGAACDRLVPLLFVTIAFNLLIGPNKGWSTYLQLGFVALVIAGTAENVTATLLMAMVLFMAWSKFVAGMNIPIALIFFSVELAVFFGMELLSPGSEARYQAEKVYRFTCGPDNSYCADSLPLFLSRFFQPRQLLALPFLFLVFLASGSLPTEIKMRLRPIAKKILFFVVIVLFPSTLFHLVSVQWIFDCYGPMRIWFPLNVLLVLLGIFAMLYVGCREWGGLSIIRFGGVIACLAVTVFYLAKHYGPTSAYRTAYDNRISYLNQVDTTETIVEVEPLPPADLVVEGDIMRDLDDDVNRDFAAAYGLPFKVKKK